MLQEILITEAVSYLNLSLLYASPYDRSTEQLAVLKNKVQIFHTHMTL